MKLCSLFFVLMGLFATHAAFGDSPEAELQRLASHPQWHRLVHYKPNSWGGGWTSELDGQAFFIAPDGRENPESEIFATWMGLVNEAAGASEENSISCRFPLRREWLKRELPTDLSAKFVKRECPRYEKWFQTVRGTSVSLVFSSFYMNNPASMFGHTFLRINKQPSQKDGRRHELLDYGVNYAANPTTDNPLMYSLLGLLGGFPGTFTIMPYYYKVREYNNAESRDLWEYELNLSPQAVDDLVRHLWELGPTHADYWYLSENCSYHVLTLLEASDSNVRLTTRLKRYVIPGDTLKTVVEAPGLIRHMRFRPSIRSEFQDRLALLSGAEKTQLLAIMDTQSLSQEFSSLSEDARRRILDAGLDLIDERHAVEVQKTDTPEFAFKSRLLSARSHIDVPSPAPEWTVPDRETPHLAHGSRRFTVGGSQSAGSAWDPVISYRFALQDLLDPVPGLPDSAQIVFFDARVIHRSVNKALYLDRFTLFEVVTLTPWSAFHPSLSWRLNVGVEREVSADAFGVLMSHVSGGAGRTYLLARDHWLYMGLQGLVAHRMENALVRVPRSYISAGPLLTYRFLWGEYLGFRADILALSESIRKDVFTPQGFAGLQIHSGKDFGLRFGWRGNKDDGAVTGELVWYH